MDRRKLLTRTATGLLGQGALASGTLLPGSPLALGHHGNGPSSWQDADQAPDLEDPGYDMVMLTVRGEVSSLIHATSEL